MRCATSSSLSDKVFHLIMENSFHTIVIRDAQGLLNLAAQFARPA